MVGDATLRYFFKLRTPCCRVLCAVLYAVRKPQLHGLHRFFVLTLFVKKQLLESED